MPFPAGWPPRASSGTRSFRFFQTGTTTANFADSAWLFSSAGRANQPLPYVKPGSTDPVVVPQSAGGGQDPNDAGMGVPSPAPQFMPRFCQVYNDSAVDTDFIEISYDGVNVHASVHGKEMIQLEDIREGGISIRTKAGCGNCAFRIIAW